MRVEGNLLGGRLMMQSSTLNDLSDGGWGKKMRSQFTGFKPAKFLLCCPGSGWSSHPSHLN